MGDDRDRRSNPSHVTIPPELKPFMGLEKFPEVEHDPELAAAFAALREPEPRQKIDPTRGVGNVQAYIPVAGLPATKDTKDEAPPRDEPKVALAMGDIPRALPSGDRSAPTEEINTRAFRDAAVRKAAPDVSAKEEAPEVDAAPKSRTLGGQTERLAVGEFRNVAKTEEPKAASPWIKDAPASARPEELPSAHRPGSAHAEATQRSGEAPPRHRSTFGLVVTIALVAVVAAVSVRALTTSPTSRHSAMEQGPVPPAPPTAAPPTAATPSLQAPTPAPSTPVPPPVPSGTPTTSAEAVSPPHVAPAPTPERPYHAPPPSKTADAPSATVRPAPAVSAEAAPPPEAPHPSAVPKPTAAPAPEDGEFFNRHKSKSP